MAYTPNNLSALAYANGFTLWHYKTPDVLGAVCEAGYFNDGVAMFRVGDFIMANTNVGRSVGSAVLIVASNAGGVVEVMNIADAQ